MMTEDNATTHECKLYNITNEYVESNALNKDATQYAWRRIWQAEEFIMSEIMSPSFIARILIGTISDPGKVIASLQQVSITEPHWKFAERLKTSPWPPLHFPPIDCAPKYDCRTWVALGFQQLHHDKLLGRPFEKVTS
jgi:hypothetical protein